ncbi:pilus assembly protein TadG-related protein [Rhodobacteraceae bacterium]|nr:pilus assembly protein TadG-related protein [Paracoccaceae bacterium]
MRTDFIRRQAKSEDGSIIIFSLFVFIMILMVAGFAVDLMRTELRRVDLQNTSDVAALASSSLDQSIDAQELVTSYFEKAGLAEYLVSVDPVPGVGGNSRSVTITTRDDVPTIFSQLIGVDSLPVGTTTTARQSATDVEISIVLDISSSMNSNNRLPRLKDAMYQFISEVIPVDPLSSASEISVNIIPYSITTNPGDMGKYYNLSDKHNYNNCVFFDSTNYPSLGISTTDSLERHTHFADNSSRYNADDTVDLPYCPIDNPILVMETEQQPLIDTVAALQGWDGTGIDVGVKWGVHLLDPSFRIVSDQMVAADEIGDAMLGRPFDYLDENGNQISRKILIIMSDGENNEQRDLPEFMREGASPVFRSATSGHYSVLMVDGRDDPNFDEANDTISRWYHEETDDIRDYPDLPDAASGTDWSELGTELVNLEWPDVMNIAKTNNVGDRFFRTGFEAGFVDAATFNAIDDPIFHRISPTDTNARMHALCAAARVQGVEIFGISFDAPSELAEDTIKNCTSSTGSTTHFFPVSGEQITEAFSTIAREVSKLRLSN